MVMVIISCGGEIILFGVLAAAMAVLLCRGEIIQGGLEVQEQMPLQGHIQCLDVQNIFSNDTDPAETCSSPHQIQQS